MNKRRIILGASVALMALGLAGCQPTSKYYWGHYETVVYLTYAQPDKMTVPMQIKTLKEDVAQANKKKLLVPPGVHAQLGALYAQAGDSKSAEAEFLAEKQLYPESTVMMDHMLTNLARK
ncbi:MAG: DUF4810 domain-containing protein [Rhizomicrobium sp.]